MPEEDDADIDLGEIFSFMRRNNSQKAEKRKQVYYSDLASAEKELRNKLDQMLAEGYTKKQINKAIIDISKEIE